MSKSLASEQSIAQNAISLDGCKPLLLRDFLVSKSDFDLELPVAAHYCQFYLLPHLRFYRAGVG